MSLTIKIKPLILVGPSGSGRTALVFRLLCSFPHKFERVISHTSRPPRKNELNGINFYFTNDQTIENMEKEKKFMTLTKSPKDHYYGLTRLQVQKVIQNHKIPILKLTLTAYKEQVLKNNIDCNALFIRVSDLKQLERRLQYTPLTSQNITDKINKAKRQFKEVDDYFEEDNIILNDLDLEKTYILLKSRLFDLY